MAQNIIDDPTIDPTQQDVAANPQPTDTKPGTVSLQDALNILTQPIQPPADLGAMGETIQQGQLQDQLPDFFRQAFDALQQSQAQSQAADAQIAAQLSQPAQDQPDVIDLSDNSTDTTPPPTQADAAAIQAQYDRRGIQQEGPGAGPGGALQGPPVTQPPPEQKHSGGGGWGAIGGALKDFGSDVVGAAEDVVPQVQDVVHPVAALERRAADARDVLHSGLNVFQQAGEQLPARAFDVESYPRQVADALQIPGADNLGPAPVHGTLGEAAQAISNENPYAGFIYNMAVGTIGFAPLTAAATAVGVPAKVLDAAFATDILPQTVPILKAWHDGDISGKDAVKQLALTVGPLAGGMVAGHVLGHAKGEEAAPAEGEAPTEAPAAQPMSMQQRAMAAARQMLTGTDIAEEPQNALDARMGRHRITTPQGDRLDWRETPGGAHISDVTVQTEKQGTGTRLFNYVKDQVRKAQGENATITGDLNSEGAVRYRARQPGTVFYDGQGNQIDMGRALDLVMKHERVSAETPVGQAPQSPFEMVAAGERGGGKVPGAKTPAPGGDDVFRKMPDDVLRQQAEYGVGGAKAELARREAENKVDTSAVPMPQQQQEQKTAPEQPAPADTVSRSIRRGMGGKIKVGDQVTWQGKPYTVVGEDDALPVVTLQDAEGNTQRVGRTAIVEDNRAAAKPAESAPAPIDYHDEPVPTGQTRTVGQIVDDLIGSRTKSESVRNAFIAKLQTAQDPEAVANRAIEIAARRNGGRVGLAHINIALKEEKGGVSVRKAPPEMQQRTELTKPEPQPEPTGSPLPVDKAIKDQVGIFRGDSIAYTGTSQQLHGKTFYDFKYESGPKRGQSGVTSVLPKGVTPTPAEAVPTAAEAAPAENPNIKPISEADYLKADGTQGTWKTGIQKFDTLDPAEQERIAKYENTFAQDLKGKWIATQNGEPNYDNHGWTSLDHAAEDAVKLSTDALPKMVKTNGMEEGIRWTGDPDIVQLGKNYHAAAVDFAQKKAESESAAAQQEQQRIADGRQRFNDYVEQNGTRTGGKRVTYEIKKNGKKGEGILTEEVKGTEVAPGLAVRKAPRYEGGKPEWTVDHIPSGMGVSGSVKFDSGAEAIAFARALSEHGDWTTVTADKMPKWVGPAGKKVIGAFQEGTIPPEGIGPGAVASKPEAPAPEVNPASTEASKPENLKAFKPAPDTPYKRALDAGLSPDEAAQHVTDIEDHLKANGVDPETQKGLRIQKALDAVHPNDQIGILNRAKEIGTVNAKPGASGISTFTVRQAIAEIAAGAEDEKPGTVQTEVTEPLPAGETQAPPDPETAPNAKAIEQVSNEEQQAGPEPTEKPKRARKPKAQAETTPSKPATAPTPPEETPSEAPPAKPPRARKPKATGGAGNGGAGTTKMATPTSPNANAGTPSVPPSMSVPTKVLRYVVRQMGGEFDPKAIVAAKIDAARNFAAERTDSLITGRNSKRLLDRALAAPAPVLKPGAPTDVDAFYQAAMKAGDKDAILQHALSGYGKYYTFSPAHVDLFKLIDPHMAAQDRLNADAGLQVGQTAGHTQVDDPRYWPRVTVSSDSVPNIDPARFTKARNGSPRPFHQWYLDGNRPTDTAHALQYYMESAAQIRLKSRLVEGIKALGNFDGKGKAMTYGKPGGPGMDGYVRVDGISDKLDRRGRTWLVRRDVVAESMRNAFSRGLPDIQKAATQPARFIRAVNFAFGPFHAIFENAALGLDNIKVLPKTLAEEIKGTYIPGINEDAPAFRQRMLEQEQGRVTLSNLMGSTVDFSGNPRGEARAHVETQLDVPEREETILDKIPVVGKVGKANREWMFNWVVPWVQHQMGWTRLRDWMIKNPTLVPQDFEQIVARNDPLEMRKMLDNNPKLRAAGEASMRHANHVAGFTENTLGTAEKQIQGSYLSTPTITRAILGNMRDAFSASHSLRGTFARQYWRNAAAAIAGLSIGGTLLAFGGDWKKAEQQGYLDPTSDKFVLNPANGKYFGSIVSPDGTARSLMPSPIRSPLKSLFSGAAVTGTKLVEGAAPQDILSSGLAATGNSALSFVQNRLSGPARFVKEAVEQEGQGVGHTEALKQAAIRSGASDVPLPVEGVVQDLSQGKQSGKAEIGSGLMTLVGGEQYAPTPFERYDNYLKGLKNADGSQRFPDGALTSETSTNGFNEFTQSDPQAKALKDSWTQHRLEAGGTSGQIQQVLQDRSQRIQAAEDQAVKAGGGSQALTQYRKDVDQIRANTAKEMEQFALKDVASTADRKTISSWYDLMHDPANIDPVTGSIIPNNLTDAQEAWKQQHPGEFERLIQPSETVGTPSKLNLETVLRKDRQFVEKSGWWKTDQQAFDRIKQAYPGLIGNQTNYADWYKARFQQYRDRAVRGGNAFPDGLAQLYMGRDPIVKQFQKLRNALRMQLQVRTPGLTRVLQRWGYNTTSKQEYGLAAVQPDQTPGAGVDQLIAGQ